MRQRQRDAHLPKCVYFKHGAYYKVVRGKWFRLGKNLNSLDVTKPGMTEAETLAYAGRLLARCKASATGRQRESRKMEFSLTRDDVHRMLVASAWRCAVTGIEFTDELIAGKRPYAPSIDRIDNARGYVRGNTRVVCVAANIAMNVWGVEVLRRLGLGTETSKISDVSNRRVEEES
jgi:hypothetical protein